MSYARVIVAGQWHYYDNVVDVWSERRGDVGEYLTLLLDAHPRQVFFWRSYDRRQPAVSVLLAATVEDYIAALQEEERRKAPLLQLREENAARRLHKEDAC